MLKVNDVHWTTCLTSSCDWFTWWKDICQLIYQLRKHCKQLCGAWNGDSYQLECIFSSKANIWKELPYRSGLMIPNQAFVIILKRSGFIDNLHPNFRPKIWPKRSRLNMCLQQPHMPETTLICLKYFCTSFWYLDPYSLLECWSSGGSIIYSLSSCEKDENFIN